MSSHQMSGTGSSKPDPTTSGALAKVMAEMKVNPAIVLDHGVVSDLVNEEFPTEVKTPTIEAIDDSILRTPKSGLRFENGQWVERLGHDMLWHLEPIRRTVKIPGKNPDESPYEYFFKTSAGILVDVDKVRAPEEGLKRHFGLRPWAWQQWANLRLESFVRFQKSHEKDFDEVNYQNMGMFLWEYWLNEPRNHEFKKLYDSKPEGTRLKLVHHLMQPLRLMNDIKDDWDFDDAGCSVYQYTAFLGSGYSSSLTIVVLQLLIPFLLLDYAVRTSNRFPNFANLNLYSYDFQEIFFTTWPQFCYQYASLDELVMNFVVFIIYSIRVLPAVFITFYQTVGDMDNVNSKLNSIRIISWLQGDDTPQMQVGYKLNCYMNSFYIALINCTMLIILFLTDSTVDIILNALAIEFVYNFDKEVAAYGWFDDNYRFLRASVLEIIICGELRLEFIRSNKVFCEQYDVDPELLEKETDGPLSDLKQARIDSLDERWCLTDKDRLWLHCARVAKASGRHEAVWQFVEKKVGFGFVDQVLHAFRFDMMSMFCRYEDLYTWSRWDKALWMSRVPEIGEYCTSDLLPCNFTGDPKEAPPFTFFNPQSSWDPMRRFFWQIVACFQGVNMGQSVGMAIRRKFYVQVPVRILDGTFEIFAYFFICIFPGACVCCRCRRD